MCPVLSNKIVRYGISIIFCFCLVFSAWAVCAVVYPPIIINGNDGTYIDEAYINEETGEAKLSANADAGHVYAINSTEGEDVESTSITITNIAGTATGLYSAAADAEWICGIYNNPGEGTVDSGTITITNKGGKASLQEGGGSYAYASARAYGIDNKGAGDVTSSGNITITNTGGEGLSWHTVRGAKGYAVAYGISSEGAVISYGDIVITNNAGTADGGGALEYGPRSYAFSNAYGIATSGDVGSVTNTGLIAA